MTEFLRKDCCSEVSLLQSFILFAVLEYTTIQELGVTKIYF